MSTHARHRAAPAGFTLVELLVVMGILSGFLLMLVQLVDGGLTLFRDGELGQALADRASHAQRVVQRELSRLRGAAQGRERERVDDRLVVQLLPIGLPAQPERNATRVQMVRAAVHLDAERELEIVDKLLAVEVLREDPTRSPEQIVAEVERRRQSEPLRSIGNMLLVPWLQEGDDDALLELRCGWFLPGQQFPLGQDRFVDPFEVPVPGTAQLPARVVYDLTQPILGDLLHVEFGLWGQATTAWGGEDGPLAAAGARGPVSRSQAQPIWDSARGGWLVDHLSGGEWGFDVGAVSEHDPSDDIHPHAILVRLVVAQPADAAPEGLLERILGQEDQTLYLYDGNRFPGANDGGFVKVGREWMRYAERDGDRLIGLRRAQRGTGAMEHPAGARVHLGRTVEFVVPVLHAKDDWNG